jgi:hypothetical protein
MTPRVGYFVGCWNWTGEREKKGELPSNDCYTSSLDRIAFKQSTFLQNDFVFNQ